MTPAATTSRSAQQPLAAPTDLTAAAGNALEML